jgi:EpsI family protein
VEFPAKVGTWQGKKSYLSQEILKNLWADDYVQIQFYNEESGDILILFVPYYEYQGTRHTAHSPVSCLLGGGFAPKSRSVIQSDFPPPFGRVEIKQMVMEKNRDLLLSNYWFQQRGRVIVSEYSNKWYLFWDSLFKRRTDGALVRLEMVLRRGQSVEDAQAVMDSFTHQLMKILPEYVPG